MKSVIKTKTILFVLGGGVALFLIVKYTKATIHSIQKKKYDDCMKKHDDDYIAWRRANPNVTMDQINTWDQNNQCQKPHFIIPKSDGAMIS